MAVELDAIISRTRRRPSISPIVGETAAIGLGEFELFLVGMAAILVVTLLKTCSPAELGF